MRTKNIFKLLAITCLFTCSTSCADWLSVDMEDGILEDKLYETNEGFLASLNGVYTKMNETYGSTLSMEVLDVMAQYYNVAQNSRHSLYAYSQYNFSQSNVEGTSGNLWTNLYNLIANINSLLDHCDASESSLKKHYYPYVKGESLALRAMLHFDLLRIYGPVYNSTTASNTSIPYQETTSKEIQPLLPASEIMEKVIRDLEAASILLKDDKIRTEGVMNSDSENLNENSDFRYRQYRLNYYAVQGLLARAYLWTNNTQKAYEIASNIIKENEEKNVFPWISKDAVQAKNPDRIFSTEVMFGLYNLSRIRLYENYFKPTARLSSSLTFVGTSMDAGDDASKITYFYQDINDIRRAMWSAETLKETDDYGTTTTETGLCFSKYSDIETTNTMRHMIPLIRMSEIYLIAAECENNLEEAIKHINKVRKNRNCVDLKLADSDNEETIQKYITNEFAREVIGEGQLFFYYKRHAMTDIMSGTSFGGWNSGIYKIQLQNYVWPLPKIETDKRVTSK